MQRVHCNLEPPGASGLDSLISAHAMRWSAARAGSGATRYTLIVNRDSGEDEVGSLEILADGRVKFELDAERAVIPFIPAIWLRRGP
jgi:hypothetical protein